MKRIHRLERSRSPNTILGLAGLFMTVLLSGCAPQPFAEDNIAKRAAVLAGAANAPGEAADFVRAQRPATPEYVPVGVTPPARPIAPRDAAAAAALEAELDAQRNRSRGFAERARPRSTYDGTIPARPAPPAKELLPQ
ncbi:MAG: hypothetical protein ACRDBL_05910 [Rhabdaerophilum sp.]